MATVRIAGAALKRYGLVVGAATTASVITYDQVTKNDGIFQASQRLVDQQQKHITEQQDVSTLKDLGQNCVREPVTGVEFNARSGNKELKGCGVRLKFGLVPVYAVALYAPITFKAQRSSIISDLLATSTELRMTLVRKVERETFVRAIHDSVSKRLNLPQDAQDLDAFVQLCLNHLDACMSAGTTTSLRLDYDSISLIVDNKLKGTTKCPAVLRALLNVYLDDRSVSPSARASILRGLDQFARSAIKI